MSAKDAARYYGLTFDRKGWAVCPFHQDKHPSMSFRGGRFRCWACNASGDSID
ncbi:CHC2 zinc finger domain-containing protein, partial [Intestinimonas butyriciproducens]